MPLKPPKCAKKQPIFTVNCGNSSAVFGSLRNYFVALGYFTVLSIIFAKLINRIFQT